MSQKKTVFLFPGQGSQKIGMGEELYHSSKIVKEVFDEADDVLNMHFKRLIFSGDPKELLKTEHTQPALLTMSIACHRVLNENYSLSPLFLSGHSLGEFSALVVAEALSFADALRVTRQRGIFMQQAVPEGEGAMAAVIGLAPEKIAQVIGEISDVEHQSYVAIANFNGPMQTVIAGHRQGVLRAIEALKLAKARIVKELPVSAPFHCELMRPAQIQLQEVLEQLRIDELRTPVIANVDAHSYSNSALVVDKLTRQVTAPVRFTQTVDFLFAAGIEQFIELGSGKTLSGMVRRMSKDRLFFNVEDIASLEKTLKAL